MMLHAPLHASRHALPSWLRPVARGCITLALFTVAFAPALTSAQTTPSAAASLDTDQAASSSSLTLIHDHQALLTELNDADYLKREAAMTTLLADNTLTDPQIDKLFVSAASLEQRLRVRLIAIHHTARRYSLIASSPEDTAILGMSMEVYSPLPGQDQLEPALTATFCYPGSTSYAYLRPGDVIKRINNLPISNLDNDNQVTLSFSKMISSKHPGDRIKLDLVRDGREMQINLPLGSNQALQSIYQDIQNPRSRQLTSTCIKLINQRLKAMNALVPQSQALSLTLPPMDAFAQDESSPDAQPEAGEVQVPERIINGPIPFD